MLKKFKNLIINKKFYWKLRHLISPDVWSAYYNDSQSNRRNFYSKYIKENDLKTIFEFGCASGPNLFNIDKNVPWNLYYFGYDISHEAIKFALKKSKNNSYYLTNKISSRIFKNKLELWDKNFFDLSIYDRVLYLLSEKEIRSHFEKYKKYMKNLIIDDFHNQGYSESNMTYSTKNYQTILIDYGFKLKRNEPSEHIMGNDKFFMRNARRLIFEKIR